MSQLFSDICMNDLQGAWSHDAGVYNPLESANFSADIAYGFKDEDQPRGLITIVNGKVTKGSAYAGEKLD